MNKEEKSAAPQTKRPAYISFKKEEWAILSTLGLRERWLYGELKWLGTFKSGLVGRWGNRRITYDQLAALVSVPASQGRAAETLDRKEAFRLMQRLENAGLVADISERADNQGLTCKLPLSPLNAATMLPQLEEAKSPVKPESTRVCEKSVESSSVLINPKNINTHKNTVGADGYIAGAGVGGAISNPPPENPNPSPQALTTSAIEKRLSASRFEYVNSAKSRRFYERWIDHGVSPEQFERAVKSIEENFEFAQIPDSVDEALRGWRKRQRTGRFGRVAL